MQKRYVTCKLSFLDDKNVEYECNPWYLGKNKVTGNVGEIQLTRQTLNFLKDWVKNTRYVVHRDLLRILGLHLYSVAFGSELGPCEIKNAFEDSYQRFTQVQEEWDGLRLFLIFHSDARELGSYPWELLFMPWGEDGFFLAGEETQLILTRFVPTPPEINLPTMDKDAKKLRILTVLSSPREFGTVEADEVIKKIRQIPHIELKDIYQPTLESLQKEINTFKPHIFHFFGHGGEGVLYLIKKKEELEELDADNNMRVSKGQPTKEVLEAAPINNVTMRGLLKENPPKLVFLHACEGAAPGILNTSIHNLNSIARDLAYSTEIPAVIAMQYEIPNSAAEKFSIKFYEGIR